MVTDLDIRGLIAETVEHLHPEEYEIVYGPDGQIESFLRYPRDVKCDFEVKPGVPYSGFFRVLGDVLTVRIATGQSVDYGGTIYQIFECVTVGENEVAPDCVDGDRVLIRMDMVDEEKIYTVVPIRED